MRIFQNLTGKKLHLYKSLDTLKILRFWDILKHKNALLLDFDYYEGKKYSNEQKNEIEQLWQRLYDEYFVLRDSSKTRSQLIKAFDELHLREKITQIKNNIEALISIKELIQEIPNEGDFKEEIGVLLKYEQEVYNNVKIIDKKIKPKYFDGLEANIINLDRVLKSYINRYNIEHKKRDENVEKEIKNVYDVVANAESWLDRHIPIEEITVSRWLSYEKQIDQKRAAQIKKNGTR